MLKSKVEACQNQAMGIYRCKNKQQCFEPCGDLGHDEKHAKIVDTVTEKVVYDLLKK